MFYCLLNSLLSLADILEDYLGDSLWKVRKQRGSTEKESLIRTDLNFYLVLQTQIL